MRRFLGYGLAATVVTLAALGSIVPPSTASRVVLVNRWSSTVKLLPQTWAWAPVFWATRLRFPQEASATLLIGTVPVTLPSGITTPLSVEVAVKGAGPLPISADQVRKKGFPAAFGDAFAAALPSHLRMRLWQAADQWQSWFPQELPLMENIKQATGQWLQPLGVASVRVAASDALALAAEARATLREFRKRGRLVVLGLDGLDWNLVDELCARGVMPNTGTLLLKGVQAELEVPPPLISPVIWTTIATGVPPEVHGVLDFLEPDPNGGPPHPVSANSRKVPAIWEILAAAGRSTATIGWWATFPAQAPPSGVVYSDRLTEQLLGLAAHTPGLADPPKAQEEALLLAIKAHDLQPADLDPVLPVTQSELAAATNSDWENPVGGLAKLVAATLTVQRLTLKELQASRDALFVYLEGTDTVGHLFAPYRPPALPGVDPALARRFGGVVDRYMTLVDRWLGEVSAQLREDDTLVIVSDHGFTWGADRPKVPAGTHTATAVWWHRPVGVFVVVSPHVVPQKTRQRMTLAQVTPTLLALAGLPGGAAMPGTLPPWVHEAPVTKVHYAGLLGRPTPKTVVLPPEARAEELAKLKALGYLGGEDTAKTPAQASPGRPSGTNDTSAHRAQARQLNNLASSLAASGNQKEAEATFRQAIAADPSYPSPHYNLATLLRQAGRFDEADVEFWQAIDWGMADPEMTVVRSALDYRQRGEIPRAERMFVEGLRRFPKSAILLENAGVFFGEQQNYARARELLAAAVHLDPNNPKAHRNLAVALAALGDTAGARHHLEAAVRLDPSDSLARAELSRLHQQPGVQ